MAQEVVLGGRNEVVLVGRVSAAGEQRELPSGDLVVLWRVVVDRPGPRSAEQPRRPTVDTIDCAGWSGPVRRRALGLVAGDVVEVHGALRRRFYRAGAASVSRWEVEVGRVVRLRKSTGSAVSRQPRPGGRGSPGRSAASG